MNPLEKNTIKITVENKQIHRSYQSITNVKKMTYKR